MKMSRGAPCSICLVSTVDEAQDIAGDLPLFVFHSAAIASSAVFMLAAAKTVGKADCKTAIVAVKFR